MADQQEQIDVLTQELVAANARSAKAYGEITAAITDLKAQVAAGATLNFGALDAAVDAAGAAAASLDEVVADEEPAPDEPPPTPPPELVTAQSVSQYGITWTFDKPYPVGQFVTGDWWVVGPVTVTSVSPAPGPAPPGEKLVTNVGLRDDKTLRHGSMVPMTPGGRTGYDSRSVLYQSNLTVQYPYALGVDRSLVSSISNSAGSIPVMQADIMYWGEQTDNRAMLAAAVLTCLAAPPPSDAFRPTYIGGTKHIYRASQLRWDRLLNLPINPADYDAPWARWERYFQRPWLDHLNADWAGQFLLPIDNQPAYGREFARMGGVATLLLNTDATQDVKRTLLHRVVQYGIDLKGCVDLGSVWYTDGGHGMGRKWPLIFAGLLLDDPSFFPGMPAGNHQEDKQTYYGTSYYGARALWQVARLGHERPSYLERLPSTWTDDDKGSEVYHWGNRNFVGQGLCALLMGAKSIWNHNAYFETLEDWMRPTDIYAANRQGYPRRSDERATWDPLVNAMWAQFRSQVPEQPDGATDLKWQVGSPSSWIPNPR